MSSLVDWILLLLTVCHTRAAYIILASMTLESTLLYEDLGFLMFNISNKPGEACYCLTRFSNNLVYELVVSFVSSRTSMYLTTGTGLIAIPAISKCGALILL